MMGIMGGVLIYAAMILCAMAMEKHQYQMLGKALSPTWRKGSRLGAGVLLVGACILMVGQWGWGMGLVVWFSILSLACLAIAILLAYFPRAVALLGIMGFCGAAIAQLIVGP